MDPEDLFDTNSLLRRAQTGDERAVESLYRRYILRVEGWTRGRLPLTARDLHDTRSIAHDVLVRSLLKTVEEGGAGVRSTFRGYVRQALRNQLADLGRRKQELLATIDDEAPDHRPSELERLLEREFESHVRSHIDELPRDARELLFLRFERGLSYADLAEHLGVPSEDAARMRVKRVVEALRRSLADSA